MVNGVTVDNPATRMAILILIAPFTLLAKKVHSVLGTQHGDSSPLSLKKTNLAGNPYSKKQIDAQTVIGKCRYMVTPFRSCP
jgi:hypothetical protein